MDYEQLIGVVIGGLATFIASGAAGATLANIITNFKLKRVDANIVSQKIVETLEETTLKVAADETMQNVIKPITEKVNELIDKINAVSELVIAQSRVITFLSSVYDKSEYVSAEQRSNLISGAEEINRISETHFNKPIKPKPAAVVEVKPKIKKQERTTIVV